MTDFDVVIGDPWSLDVDALLLLFRKWLSGRTTAEAAQERLAEMRVATEAHLLELEALHESRARVEEEQEEERALLTSARSPTAGDDNVAAALRAAQQQRAAALAAASAAAAAAAENKDLLRLYVRDTQDHWRFFEVLEHFLLQPDLIDGAVARELLSRLKVGGGSGDRSSRNRGALDDASAVSGRSFGVCRRQFVNLRR